MFGEFYCKNPKPLNGKKYRAVHLALYKALENRWDITFSPFKTCPERDLKDLERQYMKEWQCNLNYHCNHKARGWALKELLEDYLTIEKLVPDELTLPLEELCTP